MIHLLFVLPLSFPLPLPSLQTVEEQWEVWNRVKGSKTLALALPGDCEQMCHHAGLFLMGKSGWLLMPTPGIIIRIQWDGAQAQPESKCSGRWPWNQVCNGDFAWDRCRLLIHCRLGKGVRVQEPQLALLGSAGCVGLFWRSFVSLVFHLLEEIISGFL